MTGVLIAVALATLDTAIVNTALPTIARDLQADAASTIWVVSAYQIAMVASLLPLAALGEILGHRRICLAGLVLFTATSLACGLAWSLPSLVAARVLQGPNPPPGRGGRRSHTPNSCRSASAFKPTRSHRSRARRSPQERRSSRRGRTRFKIRVSLRIRLLPQPIRNRSLNESMGSRTLAGLALFALVALNVSAPPATAQTTRSAATPPPVAAGSPLPAGVSVPLALPSPISSLPPASQPQTLPYPAYGTPVPGINRGVPSTSIPQVVSLDQAVAIGFARSPLLAQARSTIEIDTAPVDLARTAVLPNISGSVTAGHSYRQNSGFVNGTSSSTTTTTTGGGSSTTPVTSASSSPVTSATSSASTLTSSTTTIADSSVNNSVSISLRQLIYDGGKVAAQLRAAKATQGSAIATYKRELQTVAYNVANAYYAALAAQRTTQVANETVRLNQVNANLVAAQIAAGTTARSDLLTAELPVAQARVALVRDQGAELSAQAAFVNAMGIDANTYVLPQDDGNVLAGASGVPQVAVPTYNTAIARAYMLRPDFYAGQLTVASTQASLKAAKLGLFPNLNGTAGYTTASTLPDGGTFRNSGSIGLALTIPIFDQGITHAQVEQARGQVDAAIAALETTREGIQLNVKQTLVSLVSASAAFDQTQAELANAREVLQATQAQYAAGVTTLPLLLNAEVGLTQALVDQVNAVYALRQAEAAFLFAEGANAPA